MKKFIFISDGWKRVITYSFVKGMQDYIEANDLDVTIFHFNTFGNLNNDEEFVKGEYSLFDLPDFTEFDAVILDCNNMIDENAKNRLSEKILASGIPAVALNCRIKGFMYVGIDNFKSISAVMEHLYSIHKCRTFAYAGGPAVNYENNARLEAYSSFIMDHSDCTSVAVLDKDYEFKTGVSHMQQLHNSLAKMPDAVVCANDNIACGLVSEAERLGYLVPGDFFVTGFDNLEIGSYFKPEISTVEQDKEKIGAAAICRLIEVLEQGEPAGDYYVPTVMKFGESCGCYNSDTKDYRRFIKNKYEYEEYKNEIEIRLVNLTNKIENCTEYEEVFDTFYHFFDDYQLDGMTIFLDDRFFDKNGLLLFEHNSVTKQNCTPVYSMEGSTRIENCSFEQIKNIYINRNERNIFTTVGIHFNDALIGFIVYRNPRFLILNQYYYDIHEIFIRHLHNLYIRKTMSEYTNKLQEATKAAELANKSKSAFLARMSHEIRTPINAVIGFSELSLKNNPDPETADYLDNIKRSSHALLAIINEVLDISRIESGKMELSETPYYFSPIIKDIYSIFQNQSERKGLKFCLNYDKEIPGKLIGDKVRIREILINLLNNAVKYTKEGSVTLNINILSKDTAKIVLEFEVSDTGIGIKQEDIGDVFTIFSRADEKNNENIEGTGLGLAIVESYIKMMGGNITVESEYGKGSTFRAVIPQVISDSTPMVLDENFADSDIDSYSLGDMKVKDTRVLLVDDNKINLKVIKLSLNHYGIEVDTADSGAEAIEKCKEYVYPIVFMDQMMPGMDGIEAMHHIRNEIEAYKDGNSKIIVLTANAMSGQRDELIANGFDEYLGKPINYKLLEMNLKKFLPKEKLYYEAKSIDSGQ